MAEVPRLDFAKFSQGTKQDKEQFGQALTNAFIEYGFAKLINHGIADKAVAHLLEQVKNMDQVFGIHCYIVFMTKDSPNPVTQILLPAYVCLAENCLGSRPEPATWLVWTRH